MARGAGFCLATTADFWMAIDTANEDAPAIFLALHAAKRNLS
jgi:hypothetical protein